MLVRALYQWRIRRLKARTPRNRQLGLPVVLNSYTDAHSAPHSAPPSRLAVLQPQKITRLPTSEEPLSLAHSLPCGLRNPSLLLEYLKKWSACRTAGKAAAPPMLPSYKGWQGGSQAKPQPLHAAFLWRSAWRIAGKAAAPPML